LFFARCANSSWRFCCRADDDDDDDVVVVVDFILAHVEDLPPSDADDDDDDDDDDDIAQSVDWTSPLPLSPTPTPPAATAELLLWQSGNPNTTDKAGKRDIPDREGADMMMYLFDSMPCT